mgnify:CR=1 FL=1
MVEQTIVYQTALDLIACREQILLHPQQYACEYGTSLLYYEAQMFSLVQGVIVFKGGQFRRTPIRSQYSVNLTAGKDCTYIILRFQKELFGISSMTPISDIDLCMAERLNATRIVYEHEGGIFPLRRRNG